MKTNYRGFELEARRERSLGGDILIYTSAVRQSDLWVMLDGGGEDDTVRGAIGQLKKAIDSYHENPAEWE